jgi:hypothetical protein
MYFGSPQKACGIYDKIQSSLFELRPTSKADARFPTLRDFPLVKSSNVSRNPEEYIGYFEDLNRAPNAEIGPKGFFEIAYRKHPAVNRQCARDKLSGKFKKARGRADFFLIFLLAMAPKPSLTLGRSVSIGLKTIRKLKRRMARSGQSKTESKNRRTPSISSPLR